jgi:uncharacterized membrane protein YeaQ/YmgE (transglycosylase-associated protein family)
MGFISWAVMGLVVGALAKWIMPGKDPGGFIVTALIGVAGALVGGWLGSLLGIIVTPGWSLANLAVATVGALLLLFVYRKFAKPAA